MERWIINPAIAKLWEEDLKRWSPEQIAYLHQAADMFIEEIEKSYGVKRPYQMHLFIHGEELLTKIGREQHGEQ